MLNKQAGFHVWQWVRRLRQAAQSGGTIDLAKGMSDREIDVGGTDFWSRDRRVPAAALRAVLLDSKLKTAPRGLQLRGAHITGKMELDYLELPCRLRITFSRFDESPSFNHASVPGLILIGDAVPGLSLRRTRITGNAILNDLCCQGLLDAEGVHVGGDLSMVNARFPRLGVCAPGSHVNRASQGEDGDSVVATSIVLPERPACESRDRPLADGMAIRLDRADINGNALLSNVCAYGEVRAVGATFRGKLILDGAKLHKSGDGAENSHALGLDLATIEVLILKNLKADGGINLQASRIRALYVEEKKPKEPDPALPPLTTAQGWELESIHGYLGTDSKAARKWLDTIKPERTRSWWRGDEFVSQPWKEMANVFDQNGQPAAARKLRIDAARRTTRFAPAWSKPVRWLYGGFVRYGYRPLIVIPWLLAIGLTVGILADTHSSAFTPSMSVAGANNQVSSITGATRPIPDIYPPFQPALFAVETAVPAVDTGQGRAWRVTGNNWLPLIFGTFRAFGWLLTALLLAGVAGLLRKD